MHSLCPPSTGSRFTGHISDCSGVIGTWQLQRVRQGTSPSSQGCLSSLPHRIRHKACVSVTAAGQTKDCWAGILFQPSWRTEGNSAEAAKVVMLFSCKFLFGCKRVQLAMHESPCAVQSTLWQWELWLLKF